MNLELKRHTFAETFTEGELYANGVKICDTIEDHYRDLSSEKKVPGETCIPFGAYPVIMSFSPRFQRMLPELLNVPHFTGIRIHPGNKAVDSQGCILPGIKAGAGWVKDSKITYQRIEQLITNALSQGDRVFINVRT